MTGHVHYTGQYKYILTENLRKIFILLHINDNQVPHIVCTINVAVGGQNLLKTLKIK